VIQLSETTQELVDLHLRMYGTAFIKLTQVEPGLTGVEVVSPDRVILRLPCKACENPHQHGMRG